VICGHIHNAGIRRVGAITYYNCGDWVESCSALVENFDGEMELLRFCPHALDGATQSKEPQPAPSLL
jgi:UDP-2,3-diacylglucosamine pyrophosphatase LpxH